MDLHKRGERRRTPEPASSSGGSATSTTAHGVQARQQPYPVICTESRDGRIPRAMRTYKIVAMSRIRAADATGVAVQLHRDYPLPGNRSGKHSTSVRSVRGCHPIVVQEPEGEGMVRSPAGRSPDRRPANAGLEPLGSPAADRQVAQ